jgi:hypothetical protein
MFIGSVAAAQARVGGTALRHDCGGKVNTERILAAILNVAKVEKVANC